MAFDGTFLYVLIIGCEVAFWMALLGGLAARYIFRWPTVSRWLLVSVPMIDVVLLAATAVDLRSGTAATFAHGLAAAYVGFTLAFGPVVIRYTDQWFAFKFGNGPVPDRPPARGWRAVGYEFRLWGRCIVACVATSILLVAMMALAGDSANTEGLQVWFKIPMGTVFFWFLFGPLWSLIFFKRLQK